MSDNSGVFIALESPLQGEEIGEIAENIALSLIEDSTTHLNQVLVVKEAWGIDEGTGLCEVSAYVQNGDSGVQTSFFTVETEEVTELVLLPNLYHHSLIISDRLSFLALAEANSYDDLSVVDFWEELLTQPDMVILLIHSSKPVRNPIKSELLMQYMELVEEQPNKYCLLNIDDSDIYETIRSFILEKI